MNWQPYTASYLRSLSTSSLAPYESAYLKGPAGTGGHSCAKEARSAKGKSTGFDHSILLQRRAPGSQQGKAVPGPCLPTCTERTHLTARTAPLPQRGECEAWGSSTISWPKSPWYPSAATPNSAHASSMATATQPGCRWVQEHFADALGWAQQVSWPEMCCAPWLRLSTQLYLCPGAQFLNSMCSMSSIPAVLDVCLPSQASSSGKR